MRKSCLRLSLACLFLAALPFACAGSSNPPPKGTGGSSGNGSGGNTSTGGSSEKGGSGGTSSATGGTVSSGGTSSATGGTVSSGGTSSAAGGTVSSGGSATGGSAGSGGSATGGAGGKGGTTTATGGAETGGAETGGAGGTSAGGAGGTATGGAGGTAAGGTGGTMAGGDGGTSLSDGSAGSGGAPADARETGGGGDPFAADGKVAQNGNRWTITMGTVVLEVGTDNAGMVTGFSIDGTNFVVINSASNGSVFWTAPQSDWPNGWPPPAEMDTAAYTPSSANNVLTMTGPVGTDNLSITKKFWGNTANQAVTLEYTVKNSGTAAVKKAPWEITRVYPGGLTVFPNSETPVVLPGTSNSFLAVPFTTAAGAAWWAYQTSQFTQDVKGGANDSEGWAAQINCGSGLQQACPTTGASANKSIILIKEWKPTTTVAPGEKEVEVYANAGHNYVEFEQQGDYQSIPAGGSITWTMHWLLRYLPSTVAPTAGSADLLTWIRGQLL